MESILNQLVKELRQQPFTLLVIVGLIGFAVFANNTHAGSAEVKQNTVAINRVLKLQLSEAIRSINNEICEEDDQAIKRQLRRTLDGLQEDYRELNRGQPYELLTCSDD